MPQPISAQDELGAEPFTPPISAPQSGSAEEELGSEPATTTQSLYAPPTNGTPWSRPTKDDDASAFNAWRVSQKNLAPAAAVSAWGIAEKRGLDPSWVADNLDTWTKVQAEEDHAAQLQQNPGLAEQFNDPVKASIIKDDMANATMWERLVTGRSRIITDPTTGAQTTDYTAPGIIRAIEKGADPRQAYYSAKDMLGLADKDDLAKLTALEAEPSDFGAQNKIESTLYGVAGAIPFMAETAAAGFVASVVGAPAAIVGGVAAGTAGVLTFAQNVGPLYRRIVQAAPGVDHDTAVGLAVGTSAFAGGLAAFLGPEAFEAVPVLGKFISTAAGEGVARAVADKTIGQALTSGLKAYGGHWLAGVGMMTGQAAANSIATQYARKTTGEVFDGMQVVEDSWAAAKDAATVMAVLGAWGPAKEFVAERGRIARMREDGARFDALVNSVKESNVPDAQIERVIAELRQSGVPAPESADDGRTIYVTREAFDAVAKAQKVNPEQLAATILDDGGAGYQKAQRANTELAIPIEKYAARMVRSGLHDQLRDDVKFAPEDQGFTNREAAANKALVDTFVTKSASIATEVNAVHERELHKALNAGVPLGQARTHADVVQAIVLTHAARNNLTPEQAYTALRPPDIIGPGGRGEPLSRIPAPPSRPGEPAGPAVEDWATTLSRPRAGRNPYIQIDSRPEGQEDAPPQSGPEAKLPNAGNKAQTDAVAREVRLQQPENDDKTDAQREAEEDEHFPEAERKRMERSRAQLLGSQRLSETSGKLQEKLLHIAGMFLHEKDQPFLPQGLAEHAKRAVDLLNKAERLGKAIDQIVASGDAPGLADPNVISLAHLMERAEVYNIGSATSEWIWSRFSDGLSRLRDSLPDDPWKWFNIDQASTFPVLNKLSLYYGLPDSEQVIPHLTEPFYPPFLRPGDVVPVVDAKPGELKAELPVNPHTGIKLDLNAKGKSSLKKGLNTHAAAVLDELIQSAKLIQGKPDADAKGNLTHDKNIRGILDFYSALSIGGQTHSVKITVKLTGERVGTIQGVHVRPIETAPGHYLGEKAAVGGTMLSGTPKRPGTITLGELLQGVKETDKAGNALNLPVERGYYELEPQDAAGHHYDPKLDTDDNPNLKQDSRGHLAIITGPEGKRYKIHLGPTADASTLAHETAHWLVDTLSDASLKPGADPEMVRDHEALMKWAGYAPGERAKGIVVKNEEKIASGWEQYWAEGKAPTKELDGVFGRFARWMSKIYGGIVGISSMYERSQGEPLPQLTNEVRGIFDRMLATSDEIQQDRASRELPPAADGTPQPVPPRKPVPQTSKAYARSTLNGQPLNTISDKVYQMAERKNSRAAIDQAAAGDQEASRKSDQARGVAAALHDVSKDILDTAAAQVARIKAIASPEGLAKIAKSAANGAGTEYIDVAQSLLEGIGARPAGNADAAASRLGVSELLARMDADGRDPNFDPDHLHQLLAKPKKWSALTPPEAKNVHDALVQVRTAANGASKVMVGTIREERKAVIAQIGLESAKRPDQGLQPVTRSADEGIVSKVLKATGLYNADNLKPEEMWKRLGNEAWKLWETTIGARNQAAKMKGEVLRNFMEKFEPLLTNGKFGALLRQELSPQTMRDLFSSNGVQLDQSKVNVETLFMAFLNLGTKSSEDRLLGGYKWEKGALLRAIGRDVPKPLLDMGQEILRYSDEQMWPLIAAHARELNGVEPPKLEKQSIIVRHADGSATAYDGGYFAAKYNSDASSFARRHVTADSAEALDRGARATVAASFTKARAARYSDVVDLNWSNYPNHINSVLHYLAYDEPVRSIGAVLRDKEFREIATRRIGIEQLQQLDDSIKSIARGHASDAAGASSFTGELISGVLRSRGISNAIGFSFGVAAQQIPSHMEYAVTAGKISAKNGNFALGRAILPNNWNQALSKSAELQYRADHYSERFREALSGHVDITNGWKQKADVASFAMMDGADRVLSHVLWDAAYRDALEGRKLPDGSIAGNDKAAVEHADRTLRELMPTHNKFEMAKSVRDPGALGALQLFRGLKNVVWNVESGLFDRAKVEAQGSPLTAAAGRYGLAAARILGSAAVLHMLGKFWGGHGKKDDDGEGLQGWATWAERTAGASLVSLNAPWGGEIAEGIADHLAHGESFADSLKKGAMELRPAPALAMLGDTVKRLGKMVDSDEETPERIGAATQFILGNLGGFANQTGKTGGYLHDVATGDQRVRGPGDLLGGALYGSPGPKNTKNAFTASQDAISGE